MGEPRWLRCFCEAWGEEVVYSPTGPWFSEETIDGLLRSVDGQTVSNATWDDDVTTNAAAAVSGNGGKSDAVSDVVGIAALLRYAASHPRRPIPPHAAPARLAGYYAEPRKARRDMLVAVLEEVPQGELPRLLPASLTGSERGQRWFRLRSTVNWDSWPGLTEWLTATHGEQLRSRARVDIADVLHLIACGGDTGVSAIGRPTGRDHPLAKDPTSVGLFFTAAVRRGMPLGFYPGLLVLMDTVEKWMEELPERSVLRNQVPQATSDGVTTQALPTASSPGTLEATSGAPALPTATSPGGLEAASGEPAALSGASTVFVPGCGDVPITCAPLLCRAAIWAYDYAAPTISLGGTFTYSGAFHRNAMCAANDYHRIAERCELRASDYRGHRAYRSNAIPYAAFATRNFFHLSASINCCSPNLCKVPLILGGVLPLVMFATAAPVVPGEEVCRCRVRVPQLVHRAATEASINDTTFRRDDDSLLQAGSARIWLWVV